MQAQRTLTSSIPVTRSVACTRCKAQVRVSAIGTAAREVCGACGHEWQAGPVEVEFLARNWPIGGIPRSGKSAIASRLIHAVRA